MSKSRELRRLFAGMMLVLGAAGCVVDQSRETAQWRRVLDQRIAAGNASGLAAIGSTLSLEQAMRLANRGNEQLASSGEDYLQAIIARNRALSVFLPTLSLAPSYTIADNGNPGASGSSDRFALSGRSQLNAGVNDISSYLQAAVTVEQRRALLLNAQASLMLNVAQVYYQILRSEASARVLAASIEYQVERLRDVRSRVNLGIARPLDQAQSEADLAGARASLTQARTDARNARAALATVIGVARVDGDLEDDLAIARPPSDREALIAEAIAHRQDLAAAARSVAAARRGVEAAVAQYYPSVSFDLNYLLYRSPAEGSWWSAGISANIPLFTGGAIHQDVRAAWSRFRQSLLGESATRRQIVEDVTVALENFSASSTKIADLSEQVRAARTALDLARRSYDLGNATNLERLSAQNALQNAELRLEDETLVRKLYFLSLQRSMGNLPVRRE